MDTQRLYGLIGFPLQNSFSAQYFNQKFSANNIKASYVNFPIEHINALPHLLQEHPQLCGLNVTIPHKKSVIPYLTNLDSTAAEIGAVNTILIHNGKLTGYNTDAFGFEQSILPKLKSWHQQALVLGTGGSSQAICYVLKKLGIRYTLVSSTNLNHMQYADLNKAVIRTHQIIINCTPVGMFPHIEKAPAIPYEHITDLHLAYDLIYLPEETAFLHLCRQQGASTQNGLNMLHAQAEKAYQIWLGNNLTI